MKYLLLHPSSYDKTPIETALISEGIATREVAAGRELTIDAQATVLLLNVAARPAFSQRDLRRFAGEGGAIVALAADGEADLPEDLPEDVLVAFLSASAQPKQVLIALRSGFRDAFQRSENQRLRAETEARTRELREIAQIGAALNHERDYETLLDMILTQARQITGSDAGSLYLVEGAEGTPKHLRFKLAQTYSRPDIPFVETTIPINTSSIAGYVATTNEPLVIDDAYFLPPDVEYSINRWFDEKYGYRTRSMLTMPMSNHAGEVIGALQLINRKRDHKIKLVTPEDFDKHITPYSKRIVELVGSLAGQAAVSIENSQLYEDIERLFEGFVTAAVTAIEQRDPTTFGHSGRVASMTVGLARVVDGITDGKWASHTYSREQLRELRYAGLLHDFGKVGVREQVLVKAKKLYPTDLSLIKQRYQFIFRSAEREHFAKRTEYLEQHGKDGGYADFKKQVEGELQGRLSRLEDFLRLVLESNEPSVLPEGNFDELLHYADEYFHDLEGNAQPFLSPDEVRYLTIRKGSLDDAERLEIESHVNHTYRFLLQIPWTKELARIPNIAYGHHEKLNGRGYPRGVASDEIPAQTRMMTIADIFDALTASDRPYKRALPIDRALSIMEHEVNDGMLDPELFEMFHQTKVYEEHEESGRVSGAIAASR
jgi:HD-GYP domain-containing protein (c-di-GMP phosphodiesterase class II)